MRIPFGTKTNWRQFIDSDNPIAAALLANMSYTKQERLELRTAFLRMVLRLQHRLDAARLALVMSVADVYYRSLIEEDTAILAALSETYPEEGMKMKELMPAWKRWGYEEGVIEGKQEGKQEGRKEERASCTEVT